MFVKGLRDFTQKFQTTKKGDTFAVARPQEKGSTVSERIAPEKDLKLTFDLCTGSILDTISIDKNSVTG
jgi:hypothetical protein